MTLLSILRAVKKAKICLVLTLVLLASGKSLMAQITQGQFDVIRAQYPDLNLVANVNSYNVIPVQTPVTETTLRNALNSVTSSRPNLIIVVNGTITLQTAALNIPSCGANGVIIIAQTVHGLTINGNNKFSGFITNGGTVKMGGIIVENCINSGISVASRYNVIPAPSTNLTLTKCEIRNNLGQYGGGIGGHSPLLYLTMTDCKVHGNVSTNNGGGICAMTVTMSGNSEVYNNISGYRGGGIHTERYVSMSNSDVYNNTAKGDGGGIAAGSINKMDNCYIYENIASSPGYKNANGGGIYISSSMPIVPFTLQIASFLTTKRI
jgi:hypothetical protein